MEIFEHLVKRQEMEGPEGAFQFKSVKNGKKVVRAEYQISTVNADANAGPVCRPVPRSTRYNDPNKGAQLCRTPTVLTDSNYALHHHCDTDGVRLHSQCNTGTFVTV